MTSPAVILNHDDTESVTARMRVHADMRVEPIAEAVQLPDLSQFPNARRSELRNREVAATFTRAHLITLLECLIDASRRCGESGDLEGRGRIADVLMIVNRMSAEIGK